jgi:hypothetical protein
MSPTATARVPGDAYPADLLNAHVATVLDETARLLEVQHANVWRTRSTRYPASA